VSPKISEHGGPSNASSGQGMPAPTHIDGVPVEDVPAGLPLDVQRDADVETTPAVEQTQEIEQPKDYAKMLKADLVDEANARDLDSSGTKDQIIERLEADDEAKRTSAGQDFATINESGALDQGPDQVGNDDEQPVQG
jgi:hypothetical protein